MVTKPPTVEAMNSLRGNEHMNAHRPRDRGDAGGIGSSYPGDFFIIPFLFFEKGVHRIG